jgi:hypothetical protein
MGAADRSSSALFEDKEDGEEVSLDVKGGPFFCDCS